MRKCLRCQTDMVENCDVKVEGGGYGSADVYLPMGLGFAFACISFGRIISAPTSFVSYN